MRVEVTKPDETVAPAELTYEQMTAHEGVYRPVGRRFTRLIVVCGFRDTVVLYQSDNTLEAHDGSYDHDHYRFVNTGESLGLVFRKGGS